MDPVLASADLVAMFEHELRLCKVQAGETMLIFTDPRFPHSCYPPAAFAAARSLGANTYIMDGRKAMYQCGIADEPGRWDHWPSGLVTCAPLEDSAEGVYVVEPGDVLLPLKRTSTYAAATPACIWTAS